MSVHFDAYERVVTPQLEWNDDRSPQPTRFHARAAGDDEREECRDGLHWLDRTAGEATGFL